MSLGRRDQDKDKDKDKDKEKAKAKAKAKEEFLLRLPKHESNPNLVDNSLVLLSLKDREQALASILRRVQQLEDQARLGLYENIILNRYKSVQSEKFKRAIKDPMIARNHEKYLHVLAELRDLPDTIELEPDRFSLEKKQKRDREIKARTWKINQNKVNIDVPYLGAFLTAIPNFFLVLGRRLSYLTPEQEERERQIDKDKFKFTIPVIGRPVRAIANFFLLALRRGRYLTPEQKEREKQFNKYKYKSTMRLIGRPLTAIVNYFQLRRFRYSTENEEFPTQDFIRQQNSILERNEEIIIDTRNKLYDSLNFDVNRKVKVKIDTKVVASPAKKSQTLSANNLAKRRLESPKPAREKVESKVVKFSEVFKATMAKQEELLGKRKIAVKKLFDKNKRLSVEERSLNVQDFLVALNESAVAKFSGVQKNSLWGEYEYHINRLTEARASLQTLKDDRLISEKESAKFYQLYRGVRKAEIEKEEVRLGQFCDEAEEAMLKNFLGWGSAKSNTLWRNVESRVNQQVDRPVVLTKSLAAKKQQYSHSPSMFDEHKPKEDPALTRPLLQRQNHRMNGLFDHDEGLGLNPTGQSLRVKPAAKPVAKSAEKKR